MNYIWSFLILISIVVGAINGKLNDVVAALLSGAETSVKIAIGICGVMVFWLGIMKIAEKSGIVEWLSKILTPVANFLFPEVKGNDKIIGNVAMNFSANALGLANAATPMGIKAMVELQKKNNDKKIISKEMAVFIVLNTASIQIIPTTVIAIRNSLGSVNPTQILLPVWGTTVCAAVSAIVAVKILVKRW